MAAKKGPLVNSMVCREFRRTEAVALYLKGYKQKEIEEEFARRGYPVDRSSISRYISETRREWKERRMEDMDTILDRELAKLDKMEQEAADLFGKFNPNNGETELCEPFDQSKEAAEWIKTRLKIMEQRHKLLGLYKPVKLDVESKNVNINADPESVAATRSTILSRLSKKSE